MMPHRSWLAATAHAGAVDWVLRRFRRAPLPDQTAAGLPQELSAVRYRMADEPAASAWRLYILNWAALGGVWVTLGILMMFGGFALNPASVWLGWGFVAIYAAFAWYNATAANRGDPQVVFVLGGFAQIVLATMIMAPFTYVAAAINMPMQDTALMALDRMLGLDWQGYLAFLHAHPNLARWIDFGYTMIKWPLFIIPVALAAAGLYFRLQQYTLAFLLALAVTTAISAFVPALGTYHELGLSIRDFASFNPHPYESQLIDLPRVRDGSLRLLDLGALTGVVTFPSFHAASAALYLWALWPVRLLRPIAIVANVAMVAATPIVGGHYFVDVIAGIVVTALAIVVAGRICRAIDGRLAGRCGSRTGPAHTGWSFAARIGGGQPARLGFLLFEHGLFGKPVPTFPDHALDERGDLRHDAHQQFLRLLENRLELLLDGEADGAPHQCKPRDERARSAHRGARRFHRKPVERGRLADQAPLAVLQHVGLREARDAQHAVMLGRGPKQIELRVAVLGRAGRVARLAVGAEQRDQLLQLVGRPRTRSREAALREFDDAHVLTSNSSL